ncbi:MAG: peptidoglycan D,D-transpeptidase FtsI family protein [Gammaproteobacteria bacterium]
MSFQPPEPLPAADGPAPTGLFRRVVVYAMCLLALGLLGWRAVDLQVTDGDFLQGQGVARHERSVKMPAHRGRILDRHGQPLAVSAPVESVWAIPHELRSNAERLPELAKALGVSLKFLRKRAASGRQFVYLRRHMVPEDAGQVMALKVRGVHTLREYRRFYPAGEATSHLLGFTNIDDAGQEGVELVFDDWLAGSPGQRRVIKDRLGRVIGHLGVDEEPRPGRDLNLSIDHRIQYLAYRELKAAVNANKAKSGAAVVLDPRTGEILAAVNQPAFNPNNRRRLNAGQMRNRAFTDQFEPGSTMKPLTILAGLTSGRYQPDTVIDTRPGWYTVTGKKVQDDRNFGVIDVAGVIKHSSNVGASKISLSLERSHVAHVYQSAGLGEQTGSGFPGESSGTLRTWRDWRPIEQATMSFGYGLSVTAIQLARAYAMIAADGVLRPVTLVKRDRADEMNGQSVFRAGDVRRVRAMMEAVVGPEGTGFRARVPGYRVAGKTGTVHKSTAQGYAEDRYVSVFAGMAPAANPRFVMVVMIDDPSAGEHYGGRVAAPVFAKVAAGALRILNVKPDMPVQAGPLLPPAALDESDAEASS